MEDTKIGSIAAIFVVVTIMINHISLSFPKNILDNTGSATPLNIIYISILAIILVLLICRLLKPFPGQDIIDISNFLFGNYIMFLRKMGNGMLQIGEGKFRKLFLIKQ